MPRRDGTGPFKDNIMGPRHVLRNNRCFGRRNFGGYGYNCRFNNTNKDFLLKQKEILQEKLNDVEKQLNEFK